MALRAPPPGQAEGYLQKLLGRRRDLTWDYVGQERNEQVFQLESARGTQIIYVFRSYGDRLGHRYGEAQLYANENPTKFVIRRPEPAKPAKAAPKKTAPKKAPPAKSTRPPARRPVKPVVPPTGRPAKVRTLDVLDPREEQFRAQFQGIYESYMKAQGIEPLKETDGTRADAEHPDLVAAAKKYAFATSTSQQQKYGWRTSSNAPSEKAIERSRERYWEEDPCHLLCNRQAYEETLSLGRKSGFYRVTAEVTGVGVQFFVWPLPPGMPVPAPYASFAEADEAREELEAWHNPIRTGKWRKKIPAKSRTKLKDWLPPEKVFTSRYRLPTFETR